MGDAACMRPRRYLRVHRALVQTSLLWARKRNRFLVWGRCGRSPGRTGPRHSGSAGHSIWAAQSAAPGPTLRPGGQTCLSEPYCKMSPRQALTGSGATQGHSQSL